MVYITQKADRLCAMVMNEKTYAWWQIHNHGIRVASSIAVFEDRFFYFLFYFFYCSL